MEDPKIATLQDSLKTQGILQISPTDQEGLVGKYQQRSSLPEPHIVDMMKNGEISLVVNSVEEKRGAISDSRAIRTTALAQRVTYYTTIAGARAAVEGMKHLKDIHVYPLQDLHKSLVQA